jgi:LysR family glycine cleavage system transcriptional activator
MDKLFRPPSLQALQALVLAADSASFTEVADKLHLTQSAVSRKIQQLESHYGVPLFVRNSRAMQLTEHGKAVLEVARKVFGDLRTLSERIAPREGPFRIRIHVSLAVRWLLPRLTDFYAEHPDLALSIETVASESVDPSGACDACILYLADMPNDRAFVPLFDEYLVPVCAPASVNGRRPPTSLDELAPYTLIHGSTGHYEWTTWLQAQGEPDAVRYKHITFNLDELAMDAAARGLGVAMTDLTLARETIGRGDLIVPFGPELKTGGGYALWLQTAETFHPAQQRILQWFTRQSTRKAGNVMG